MKNNLVQLVPSQQKSIEYYSDKFVHSEDYKKAKVNFVRLIVGGMSNEEALKVAFKDFD